MKSLYKLFLPFYKVYEDFFKTKLQSKYVEYLKFRLGLLNRVFPAHKNCSIANVKNIHVGINCLIGRPGNLKAYTLEIIVRWG